MGWFHFFVLSMAVFLLSACGGGGGSSPSSGSLDVVKTGYFEKVEGLSYKTSSDQKGITDSQGAFRYRKGDEVAFYTNGLYLGSVQAKDKITSTSFQNPGLVLQTLHALDIDANATNGITISSQLQPSSQTAPLLKVASSPYISLEETDESNSAYISFLKQNGALLRDKQTAIVAEIAKKFKSNEKKPTQNSFVHLIMTGAMITPPFSRYADDSLITNYVEYRLSDKTDSDNYAYRVQNVALYKMMLETLKAQSKDSTKILSDQESFDKEADALYKGAMYTVNSALDIQNVLDSDQNEITSLVGAFNGYSEHAKDTIDYSVDSFMPEDMQPNAKLAVNIAFDCAKKDLLKDKSKLKGCAIGVVDNGLSRIIDATIKEKYPIGYEWAKGAKDIILTDLKVYNACSKPHTESEINQCIKEVVNATLGKVLEATATVAKIYHLGSRTKEQNSKALAYEMFFTAKYYGVNIIFDEKKKDDKYCYMANPYNFNLGTCKESSHPLNYVVDHILDQNIIRSLVPGILDTDPGYDIAVIKETLQELNQHFNLLYSSYNQKLKKQYGSDSKKQNIWIYEQVDISEPKLSVTKTYNDGSVDLKACFKLNTSRTLKDFEASLVLKGQKDGIPSDFNIDYVPDNMGIGTKNICGTLHYATQDIKSDVLSIVNNVSFKFYNNGLKFDISNFKLYDYAIEIFEPNLPNIDFSVEYNPEQKSYYLKSSFIQGIDTINRYDFYWDIKNPKINCSVKTKNKSGYLFYGAVSESANAKSVSQECLGQTAQATLKVYDSDGLKIGSITHPVSPVKASTPTQMSVSVSPATVNLNAGESEDIKLDIQGGINPHLSVNIDNPFFSYRKNRYGGYTVFSSGASENTQKANLTFTITDRTNQAKTIKVDITQLAKKKDEPLTIATNLKNYKIPYSNYNAREYATKETGSSFTQKWWLQNSSLETLYDVKLKPSIFCNTYLNHNKSTINLGDIRPNQIVTPSLNISGGGREGKFNYCQWDIYAKNSSGKEVRLLWEKHRNKASINYWILSKKIQDQRPVIEVKDAPEGLKATQTDEGMLLSWNSMRNVYRYVPMYSMDFTKNGKYADMTSGCDFKTKTSCLIDSHHFDTQKVWYFAVKADNSPISNPVRFEWQSDKILDNGMSFNGNPVSFNEYFMQFSAMNATSNYLEIYLANNNTGHQFSFLLAQFRDKDEFLNAFKGNRLDIKGNNIYRMLALPITNNEHVAVVEPSGNFILHIVKNSDGTFTLSSTGYAESHYESLVVSDIHATHIGFTKNTTQDRKYKQYLAGKTLFEHKNSTIREWRFDHDLKSLVIQAQDGTYEKSINLVLETNGLKVLGLNSEIEYFVIKSVKDDYLILEYADITDGGIYLSHDYEVKLYFNELSITDGDLAGLITGKTLYQHCNGQIDEITFGSNGAISINSTGGDTEKLSYTIDGTNLYTYKDGEQELHALIESTETYITFDDEKGETSTFYFSREDAQNASSDDCGDDSASTRVDNLIHGHVTFKDKNNNTTRIPSDAWIRITPQAYRNDNEGWNGLRCKIQSNGNFGNECYLDGNNAKIEEIKQVFIKDQTTYQVVVFKNHIKPNEYRWDEDETVYNYVGEYENSSAWQNIEVFPSNYQDNSHEKNIDFGNIGSNTSALIYPNGGERWIDGSSEIIKWNTNAIAGDTVSLYVLHDNPSDLNQYASDSNNLLQNKHWYNFADNIRNTGSYTVDPKYLNGSGNAYIILIIGSHSGWDISNKTFELRDSKSTNSHSLSVTYHGEELYSTNITTKLITIKEQGAGFAHIPYVKAILNNGYVLEFKYCALNGSSDTQLCSNDDWLVKLANSQNKILYNSSGGFATGDDPYNGKINGTFSSTQNNDTIYGEFTIENMDITRK
jgi:hypothetical protein